VSAAISSKEVSEVKIVGIQMQSVTGRVALNNERAFQLLERAQRLYEPDVILLPEAFAAYGSAHDMGSVAEPVPGPTTDRFCEFSAAHDVLVLFGLVRRDPEGGRPFNSAVIVDQGRVLGVYDKTHLTMDLEPEARATANEQEIYQAGDRLGVFDTRFGRIGVLVCHDGDYPEVFRALALEGAEALFWIAQTRVDVSGWAKGNAVWNTVPVFLCNLAKKDDQGRGFAGRSAFFDYKGHELDTAGTAEAFLYADVDMKERSKFLADGLSAWSNHYRVRRPELYGALTRARSGPSSQR
jgi:predicted amidohydrolase